MNQKEILTPNIIFLTYDFLSSSFMAVDFKETPDSKINFYIKNNPELASFPGEYILNSYTLDLFYHFLQDAQYILVLIGKEGTINPKFFKYLPTTNDKTLYRKLSSLHTRFSTIGYPALTLNIDDQITYWFKKHRINPSNVTFQIIRGDEQISESIYEKNSIYINKHSSINSVLTKCNHVFFDEEAKLQILKKDRPSFLGELCEKNQELKPNISFTYSTTF